MKRRARLGVVLVALAGTLILAPAPTAAPEPGFPGGRYYTIGCGFSHRNNDDPVALPRQPGRSHNHTYIGNRTVNAATTAASLRGGPSTCEANGDSSAYWVPTLYVGRTPIAPLVGLAYYVKRTAAPIQPFPTGLKMIAGDPDAIRPQDRAIVGWSCGGVGSANRFATVPECPEYEALQLRVHFPDCWDGERADSADHRRHLAYSSSRRCPATHPVAVPGITLIFLYAPVPASARLSSGKYGSHADFINGWDQDVLAFLIAGLNRVGDRRP